MGEAKRNLLLLSQLLLSLNSTSENLVEIFFGRIWKCVEMMRSRLGDAHIRSWTSGSLTRTAKNDTFEVILGSVRLETRT
jgi:hypothetical protein